MAVDILQYCTAVIVASPVGVVARNDHHEVVSSIEPK
jgi:hypothetical protein